MVGLILDVEKLEAHFGNLLPALVYAVVVLRATLAAHKGPQGPTSLCSFTCLFLGVESMFVRKRSEEEQPMEKALKITELQLVLKFLFLTSGDLLV